ncbi:hypothetical protein BC936DRAFT_142633 [Jimgerdemannia flammicorona]|uniref:Uncharacterized protein n=2 Tax=Jimgerdemannia flammicorona TaxID=994334 RepID=A0A433A047_9FUNG|nr:hypothetical protein BC936DRAFT_142633 [Jimgerdemannia flammicorona]RUS14966.1 hypothetical protein BC938DRAFT_477139 [Jimgerdemannia flammicorona]
MPMAMYAQERKASAQYTSQPPIVAITPAASNPMSQRTAPVAQMASLPNNSQLSQHNVSFAPQYPFAPPPGRPTLRRKGSLESISSVMTEGSSLSQKKRMHDAVVRLGEGDYVDDIVDMLLTLKRKERSLCLFNADFLRDKVKSAKEALDVFQDDDVDFSAFTTSTPTTPIPQSIPKPTSKPSKAVASGISTTPPAATVTKVQMSSQIATTSVPTLPSAQVSAPTTSIVPQKSRAIPIVAPRAQSPTTPEPQIVAPSMSKADEAYAEIEKFWGSISHLPQQDKKQKLGDRLFPLVKATGVKPAPKITIRLLDTIELRELAHLMYDGNTLKEKAKEAAASL